MSGSGLTDLEVALALADAADAVTTSRFRASDLVVETKPDLTPVSDADRTVEQAIRGILARTRPHDAVVGEEFGGNRTEGRRWVVDPIDGTKNFVRGVPVWATLIALLDGDAPLVGAVSAPALARRWWAATEEGAWARDPGGLRRLRVSAVTRLADASLSLSSLTGWSDIGRRDAVIALTDDVWRTRAYGDFWSYMLVAEGAVDLAAEPDLELWDMAALAPIVTEAGGRFTNLEGVDGVLGAGAVASNRLLHEDFLHALRGGPQEWGTDMAYDEDLADRIRSRLAGEPGVVEKRMFGGLAFLINGNMAVSASSKGGLLLRVHPSDTDGLVQAPGVQRFEMRGREMDGWLRVEPSACATDEALARWVSQGVNYARTLPPK